MGRKCGTEYCIDKKYGTKYRTGHKCGTENNMDQKYDIEFRTGHKCGILNTIWVRNVEQNTAWVRNMGPTANDKGLQTRVMKHKIYGNTAQCLQGKISATYCMFKKS